MTVVPFERKEKQEKLPPLLDSFTPDHYQIFPVPDGFTVADFYGMSLCYRLDHEGGVVLDAAYDRPLF